MMRMVRDWGLAIVVGAAVFFAVDWMSRRSDTNGDVAPAFTLADSAGGAGSLSEYKGQVVVLNFWGTWCPPCRHEIPEFAEWAKDNPDVPIVGIAQGSGSGERLASDARRLGVTWRVLEADDAVLQKYGVDVFPTTIVVGTDGVMKAGVHGAIGRADLDRMVAAAR